MVWEQLEGPGTSSSALWRAPVFGGWLVCTEGYSLSAPGGITFVPDPGHVWKTWQEYGKDAEPPAK